MSTKKVIEHTKNKKLHYIKDRIPPKYELVLVYNERGLRQAGWWNGAEFEFGKDKITPPFEKWEFFKVQPWKI